MDKPIGKGDLIMQVRACCSSPKNKSLGMIGIVDWVRKSWTQCAACDQINDGIHVGCLPNSNGVPIEWVKRIDPLPESERTPENEEITA